MPTLSEVKEEKKSRKLVENIVEFWWLDEEWRTVGFCLGGGCNLRREARSLKIKGSIFFPFCPSRPRGL